MPEPLVTVIIPTYNWSSVLRYSIGTVLWQTFRDFELLVIGDACTDDSEAVVRSFSDPRVQWHNLPQNSGNQSGPNNRGLELARGRYIAYLGHDDIWHPRHLELLLPAMQNGADIAYTICEVIGPPPEARRGLSGFSSSGKYEYNQFVPPSSMMHKHDLTGDIGVWKHYNEVKMPPDIEFLTRALEFGKRFEFIPELSVFKFPSNMRKNVYKERPCHEQAQCVERLQNDPDFVRKELIAAVGSLAQQHPQVCMYGHRVTEQTKPGDIVRGWREWRGLDPR